MGLIYNGKKIKVTENYSDGSYKGKPRGAPYWTVLNTQLKVHRHYDSKEQALAVARRTDKIEIPKDYGKKMKRDILYLLTGDLLVYGDYYKKKEEEERAWQENLGTL